jgi:hypothetical protein
LLPEPRPRSGQTSGANTRHWQCVCGVAVPRDSVGRHFSHICSWWMSGSRGGETRGARDMLRACVVCGEFVRSY